jgi:acyl-CoA reductase-like NAD-dependent aldehyde dehydrogenase
MVKIRDDEVQAIIQRVKERLGDQGGGVPPQPRQHRSGVATAQPAGDGIFPTVDAAVEAACQAFQRAGAMGLERRKAIISSVRQAMRANARDLAVKAHQETGIGRTADKILKNLLVTNKTPGPEDLEPQVWTGDLGMTITEWAPFGVIGAITPTTNPTSTIINNTIAAVSAGNAIVFNVHPNARQVSIENVQLINQAIVAAGGAPNLVTAVSEPTIASAQALMRHPQVRILLITGGPAVVAEAQRSNKRAILAGPGNPPVVVDETADIALAAREIVRGASFDNNLICIDEKEVIAVDAIADDLVRAMTRNHALLLKQYQLRQLERVIFTDSELKPGQPAHLNPKWIGRNAGAILGEIGIRAGDEVRLAIAEVPADHPLIWSEQMMPVLPVVRVGTVDQAIDLAVRVERLCRHTASIFSRDVDAITRMARKINVSIFVANSANLAGLGDGGEGYSSFSIASPTGEGLTRPRSFSRERRMVVAGGLRII